MSRCCPLMAIVPISLFLTASFFVLFALRKVAEKWLKVLGYLAVSSLLLAALIVFSGAVFNLSNGLGGMKCPMSQKINDDVTDQIDDELCIPAENQVNFRIQREIRNTLVILTK